MDSIPIALPDIPLSHGTFDSGDNGFVLLIDHKAVAAETGVFRTAWCVKIPCSENFLSNTNMT